MREILKKQMKSRTYKIDEEDFLTITSIIHDFVDAKLQALAQKKEELEKEMSQEEADEIFDDINYYGRTECVYLWTLCLWRLQALFEGMIEETFLPSKPQRPLFGLKAKLDAMKAVGYTISQQYYDELFEWAGLRNALSHFPQKTVQPISLNEDDILEYKKLLEEICRQWRKERAAVWHPKIINKETDHYARPLD